MPTSELLASLLHDLSGMMRTRHPNIAPLFRQARILCETAASPLFLCIVLVSSLSAVLLVWAGSAEIAALKESVANDLRSTALSRDPGADPSAGLGPQPLEADYQFLRARTGRMPGRAPESAVVVADKIRRLREREKARLFARSSREEREILVASYQAQGGSPGGVGVCEDAMGSGIPGFAARFAPSPLVSRSEQHGPSEPERALCGARQ
jgi:hypothetical protein